MYERKIDKIGRVIIPAEIRRQTGIESNSEVEITLKKNKIHIKIFKAEGVEKRTVGVIRKVDSIGGVVIPAKWVFIMNINENDILQMELNKKEILLYK